MVIYTAKTATQFTGCQRGAFGTSAAQHSSGVAVKANMVSGFLTALQSALLAIENEVGVTSARNYVRKDGAVTITGLKSFVDGAEFGAGAKAGTGLVRLPNDGALRWRKADNSGDLGMSLNAANHVAMEAIIDFAVGQTFGAFSYPDATTGSKGIVQIDAVGGLVVAAGLLSLANTAVTPGMYAKVTVDAKGRVTAGASLAASDVPAHSHVAGDIVSGAFGVSRGGTGLTQPALPWMPWKSGSSSTRRRWFIRCTFIRIRFSHSARSEGSPHAGPGADGECLLRTSRRQSSPGVSGFPDPAQ